MRASATKMAGDVPRIAKTVYSLDSPFPEPSWYTPTLETEVTCC